LFLLFLRLTGLVLPALVVAALFGWHPLHVESVAWAAERKDVLSTFFALLTLLSYTEFARRNSRRSYWMALGFFALGLLAKPMLVTLPFVLLLLDFWPLQRWSPSALWPLLREKIPFLALTAASCVVTFIAQRAGHAVVSLGLLSLRSRLESPPVAALRYLLKILWPVDLAFFYPYVPAAGAAFVVALTALILISAAAWLTRQHNRCWWTGWLWFLGMLVPVIGLVQVGGAAIADRYTYLPSIGLFAAVVFGLYGLPRFQKIFPLVMALPLVACLMATERQIAFWRDSNTLLRHTIAVTKDNEAAHYLLAVALDRDGRTAESLAEYREALRLNPDSDQLHWFMLHLFIGDALAKMGQPADALAEYHQGLALEPGNALLHAAAGSALAAQSDLTNALPEFANAERLNPHFSKPHLELARIYFRLGADSQARDELRAAVQAQPDDLHTLLTVARYLAANTNAAARDGQSALVLALQAKGLGSDPQPDVYDVLGMAFAATGDFADAVTCEQNALQLARAARLKNIDSLRARLELFQKQEPWLESFRATNAPAQ
jgi:tetratricopeptide (TPR) repeat protein